MLITWFENKREEYIVIKIVTFHLICIVFSPLGNAKGLIARDHF